MDAETAWVQAVVALGGDRMTAERSARELVLRYAEPHRRYHGRSHVEAVLADAERLAAAEGLGDQQQAILTLGVCAHDVVYDARPGEDEQASAEWARHHLTYAGLGEDLTGAVEALVLTTLTHSFEPDDVVAAVLSDADLAILATDVTTYDAYSSAVREEYAEIPDDLWVAGRRHVLEQLLAKPRLFATTTAFALWEEAARRNMRRELRMLPAVE